MSRPYDDDRLTAAIDHALAAFIPHDAGRVPGTREAIVAYVTESALNALRLWCGEPHAMSVPASTPGRLLGYPIRVHEPCANPKCALCTGQVDLVFGKPSRFSP